jgi:hypothetical protein
MPRSRLSVGGVRPLGHAESGEVTMLTILLIVVAVLLLSGVGFSRRRGSRGF